MCTQKASVKKGGNNVASLIFKYLKENGILILAETEGTGKRLSLIFDNCAGQNQESYGHEVRSIPS